MTKPAYAVGRGKPPRDTQYKKGTSGNPSGRPRGSRDLRSSVLGELRKVVSAKENGREVRVSKIELLIKALIAKGAGGDIKAAMLVIDLMLKLDDGASPQSLRSTAEAQVIATHDDEIIAAAFRRTQGGEGDD